MTILILGATSGIGSALSVALARGNFIIASGRDQARLSRVSEECRKRGAKEVTMVAHDLSSGMEFPIESHLLSTVDLIVNAASASSGFRDDELEEMEVISCIQCDINAPIQLILRRLALSISTLDVIFISSSLAKVRSPKRSLYGGLKSLQEDCLRILEARGNVRVLIACVAFSAKPDAPWDTVASKIIDRYRKRRRIVVIGVTGRLLHVANAIHPGLAILAIKLSRLTRPRARKFAGKDNDDAKDGTQ